MEKKNSRTTAFSKITTHAQKTQAANRPITEKKATIPDEILERAKAEVELKFGIKVRSSWDGRTSREWDPRKNAFKVADPNSDTVCYPTLNPDFLNPYLNASKSPLPVSPEVISFIYSLDGQAEEAKSTSDYDEQWKKDKCIFTSWCPYWGYSYCFIDKEILEIDKSREEVTGIKIWYKDKSINEINPAGYDPERNKIMEQTIAKNHQFVSILDSLNKTDE
ncbi:hypothetical protein IKQ19_08410 [Candidatus Saccharibacteria bacterium]|nr:hypothetical protein [Candidatus Saccharibacteria bacterium]